MLAAMQSKVLYLSNHNPFPMEEDTFRKMLLLSGTAVIILYCAFTLISWIIYPEPFGPLTHYLSRLGNVDRNPAGAIYYNLGCITTGLALVPFFTSLFAIREKSFKQEVPLHFGQALGVTSGIALIMIGVFSEDQGTPHMMASSIFFLLNFFVLLLLSIAILLNHSIPRWIGIYGLGFDLVTLLFELTIGGPLTEWFTVFGSLFFVLLIVIATARLTHSN